MKENQPYVVKNAKTQQQIFQCAKDYLHKNEEADFTLFDQVCQKKFGAIILKPVKAYKMYRKIVKYFATRTLMEFCKSLHEEYLNPEMIEEIRKLPLYTQWENVGGQIIPCEKINELFADIKSGKYVNWDEVHDYYNLCEASYEKFKVRYALYLLEQLYSRPIEDFSPDIYRDVIEDVIIVANEIYNHSVQSREKDYTDYYRNMTYRNRQEMEIVIGPLSDNSFLNQLKIDTEQFVKEIGVVFKGLIK